MSEHKTQKEILDYFERLMFDGECVVARVNAGTLPLATGRFARGAVAGFPDIVLLYKGTFYGIEVKSKTGKQTPEQKRMQRWITQNGGVYLVVKTLQEVLDALGK